MLTIVLIVLIGLGTCFGMMKGTNVGTAWSIVISIAAMFVFQIIVILLLRRASNKINTVLQMKMQEISGKLRAMQNQFMRRPLGSEKQMIQALEREQNAGIQQMIDSLVLFRPLYLWNPMMKKQVRTMEMMFYFQMKQYEEVDKRMEGCVFFDPQSICIKLARMYSNKEEQKAIDKFFKKKCARLRGNDCLLPYALYSWILVKQVRIDDAIKILNDAKIKTSDNEVIVKNQDALKNGKIKQFSNAGLGEMWYALYLEEPKRPRVQQQAYHRR